MSDFSLTLVLQIKTSKIINDMAKVQQRSEKITAFGGTFFVLDKFDSILSSLESRPQTESRVFCSDSSPSLPNGSERHDNTNSTSTPTNHTT